MTSNENQDDNLRPCRTPRGGTLGIFGWGCPTGTLEPLAYTRANSAEFRYPIMV